MIHVGGFGLLSRQRFLAFAALASAACGRVSYDGAAPSMGTGGVELGGPDAAGIGSRDSGTGGSANAGTASGATDSGGTATGGAFVGGASNGGATASGGADNGGAGNACRPGDPSCGTWRTCDLEFSTFDRAEAPPKTSCNADARVSAVSLPSERLDGLNTRFELIASPVPNIMIAGSASDAPGVSLYGLTPDLALAGGSTFQSSDATSVVPKFLRRGASGRTFVVGTTDGRMFPAAQGAGDVFVLSANASDVETGWYAQIGSDRSDWVQGAAAMPGGALAAVGTLGSPDDVTSKRVLWLWDSKGVLQVTRELKFENPRAAATGFEADALGNLYLITVPSSGLHVFSHAADTQYTMVTGEEYECRTCTNLAVTAAGATYLLGTRPGANGEDEVRLSRHDSDLHLTWTVGLRDDFQIASLFAGGNHVILVGTVGAPDSYGMGVLFELDQTGTPVRQLRFANDVRVLSASRADSGRVDVLLRSAVSSSNQTLLVQLAP